jgi:hypothetical protein
MATFCYCPKPNSHFLADVSYGSQKNFDPNEAEEEKSASYGIGRNSPSVVIGNHHNDAWASYHQEERDHF